MSERIVVTAPLPGDAILWLEKQGWFVTVLDETTAKTKKLLQKEIKSAIGLLCLLTDSIDETLLSKSTRLRAISTCSAGFDHIDIQACNARNIPVAHTPGVLTDATADLTMALLLAVTRQVTSADQYTRKGKFKRWEPNLFIGSELRGKRLGLIGYGKIGKAVAERAFGFGLEVVANGRTLFHDPKVQSVSLDELLKTSHIVSLHCPLTRETHHLLNSKRISQMKEGSFLINTARGPIVDELTMIDALKTGHLGGAGLDVYEAEPRFSKKLLRLSNVVLLPHIGSATLETRAKMAQMSARQLDAMLHFEMEGVFLVPGSKAPFSTS